MERKSWFNSGDSKEEEMRKDSLYLAAEIVKEYAKSNNPKSSLSSTLGQLYSELEKLRKNE